jgi:hypothetical protein
MTKMVLVPADLLQALGAYLIERPYKEVFGFIGALQSCKPVPEPKVEAFSDGHQS